MIPALNDMLEAYEPETPLDYEHAAREVVQEIALLGLWRGGFFKRAAFYGGTALRIFHGLRRYSEDLDFTLLAADDDTRLEHFLSGVAIELESWGFTFDAEARSTGTRTGSAFLKGNTQLNLLHIGAPDGLAQRLPKSQKIKIKIKLEMDIDPPALASTEVKTQLLPTPYQVTLYDPGSLFAGKLHAVLCRGWKERIKGRDFYDFVWYVGRNIAPNLAHLDARMRQSGHWEAAPLTAGVLTGLLEERFEKIDFRKAADEVRPFLHDPRELELWSTEFFLDLAQRVAENAEELSGDP